MKKFISFLLFGLLLTSGCSPFSLINSEVYNHADLAAYNTYRIVSPEDGKLPPGMNMIDYYNIANAVRTQMEIRGYKESSNAVLMINFGLTVQTKIATEPAIPPGAYPYNGFYPYFIYPRAFYWQSYYANAKVITGIYKEGVLTMDMVNIKEKMYLYSSSVSTILDSGSGALRNVSEIQQAVQVLFSKYPVKPIVTNKK